MQILIQCIPVLLRGCYQQLERDCCSLTKRQLPRSMSQATWIILKVTWCLGVFVLRGILVNKEATPEFKFLHYQSLDECLWTNFLECLILSFSICKRGKLRIRVKCVQGSKSPDPRSSVFYLNKNYYSINLL